MKGKEHTLTAGRCVSEPLSFNMAPEILSPILVLRRWCTTGVVVCAVRRLRPHPERRAAGVAVVWCAAVEWDAWPAG